jgi:hypothetical protein
LDDYYVRFINLPITVKGLTVVDETGFYNIYINSRLSYEEQERTKAHELEHIKRGDFSSYATLEEIETM